MKVMIVVTHLLGTGHLARALTLARAFAAAGHAPCLVSGGMPAPQLSPGAIDLRQLPPLRSNGTDFTRLLDSGDAPAGPALMAARQAALLAHLDGFRPDVLMTELFPFGRRVLAAEFLALLSAAEALPRRPVVLASVRDILAPPSKPEKAARAEAIITRHYDAVLVHSDPATTPLDRSWPVSPALAARLRYTGYVAPPAPPPPPAADPGPPAPGRGEILVAAGGGAVGDPIFAAALAAAARRPDRRWRLLVGGTEAAARIARLSAPGVPANARLEPARPDYRALLAGAEASVSMCGYNTALDLLQTGVPAVLVPFDAGSELEQGLRAESLARLPGFAVVKSADLGPETLLRALDRARAAGRREPAAQNLDGARRSVAIAEDLERARR